MATVVRSLSVHPPSSVRPPGKTEHKAFSSRTYYMHGTEAWLFSILSCPNLQHEGLGRAGEGGGKNRGKNWLCGKGVMFPCYGKGRWQAGWGGVGKGKERQEETGREKRQR